MIPEIERIKKKKTESIYVGHYSHKWFERTWHYHPEYELILITKGFGTRVIGSKKSKFKEGDLVLLGENIPHAWFSDPLFFDESHKGMCESIYIQFNRSIFGNYFSNLPEMKPINILLNNASFGLQWIDENKNDKILQKILELTNKNGLERLLSFIDILYQFQQTKYELILSEEEGANPYIINSNRIKYVHEYVMKNYMKDIKVEDAANLVDMNISAFCRYFKKLMQRTFTQYLKEVRIDFAQQLLINTNLTSSQIGFECGFNSIAYFNQCFKSISKISPLEFRSSFKVDKS